MTPALFRCTWWPRVGEPATLWEAAGIDADPVLAWIAMQELAR